ncbi:baeRF2 domain-containing protein [Brachybacterium sp. DNPG3]
MKLPWLKPVLDHPGPLTTVHLDTTREDARAAADLGTRWSLLRTALAADGAPAALLDEIEESVLAPPGIGGRHGRTIIAADDGILVDRVLPVPPQEESAVRGEHARLVPLVRLTTHAVPQLLVLVDRAGADLRLRAPEDPALPGSAGSGGEALGADARVDGGHDELHKAALGGGRHGWRVSNAEARVEDSWERNADAVAATVDRVVRERSPEMVLLSGDVRAVGLLRAALGQESRDRLVEVSGGVRGTAPLTESFRATVAAETDAFVDRRERELGERFRESQRRDGASVGGADETAAALGRGQVEELLLVTDREPARIEELLRLALATDAGITALRPGVAELPEGVGALLRWRDGATPSNRVGSMSGDSRREDPVTA